MMRLCTGLFTSALTCRQHLPPRIPRSLEIVTSLWSQKPGAIQFHERLVVTDIGGVLLDPGFDEGKVGEMYDIRLLSLAECQEDLARFAPGSLTYDLVDSDKIVGAKENC